MPSNPASAQPSQVHERWQGTGSGEHYVTDRWRGKRARERDPRLIQRLLRTLPADAAISRVLDVPCGTGRLRGALNAPLVVQADISMSMLQNIPIASQGSARMQASVTALPFADDAFDLVVCCRLLHHLREPQHRAEVLAEALRVSRRYVIASYWDSQSWGAWRHRTQGPFRRRGRPDVRQAVDYAELCASVAAHGGRILGRAHSFRFVSQQAFFVAEKNAAPPPMNTAR